MKMCAIYDAKAEAWLSPLFFKAVGAAIRSFGDAINIGGEDAFSKHPEDFTLFLLGDFDESTGKVELAPAPVALATGVSMVKPVADNQISFPGMERKIG